MRKFYRSLDRAETRVKLRKLVGAYPQDLDIKLKDEFIHFIGYFRGKGKCDTPMKFYKFLMCENSESACPNVEVAYRLYWCLMIRVASGERLFSKLIMNRLRSAIAQYKLWELSIIILCLLSSIS